MSLNNEGTSNRMNVVMCGTGEYTTGYVHGEMSQSDKKIGVVALVLIDLRRRGKVGNLGLCGTTGLKFPGIRKHLQENIANVYKGMDVTMETFPEDSISSDATSYKLAIDKLKPGDGITIFTPDDTHFDIALYAIQRGIHVLLTKPAVKTVRDHKILIEEAKKHNVLVCIEVHKRWDQIYADARERIRKFGNFGFFQSYMSQPKRQLETFKSWAGKSSDISYYLNSHHVDYHCWCIQDSSKPIRVTAMKSTGIAEKEPYNCAEGTEDTITLCVQWQNSNNTFGSAVYTSSWAAPKAEVHSQQRFFYLGQEGEVRVNQAHRGYEVATDSNGYASVNPLFMKYSPDSKGYFAGQHAYGYLSIESWIDACSSIKNGTATPSDFVTHLPTIHDTLYTTAILEAGRKSLDSGGMPIEIVL